MIKIFILIMFSLKVFSSDCAEVNLYETNANINSLPIELQGDMNTCYAHSLAGNYNILKASSKEDRIHPYWIAFIHKNKLIHWTPKNLDFSFLAWAWKDLKKWGRCDYSVVQDQIDYYKRGVPYSNDQFFFLLRYYFKVKFYRGVRKEKRWNKVVSKLYEKLTLKTEKFTYPWSEEEILRVIEPIREISSRERFFKFLKKRIFKNCLNNRTKISEEIISYGMKTESNTKLAGINNKYLLENKPISIGHCPDVTYDPGAVNKDPIKGKPRLLKALSGKCGAHYALLVGSRKKGNSCQYLMRNTYGKGFWVDKSLSCYCEDKNSGERGECRYESFDKNKKVVLGCWIDREKLLTNSYEFEVFR